MRIFSVLQSAGMALDPKILIGKRIRGRRETLKMSQLRLAELVGKESATYIALIENGVRNVRTSDLLRIAEVLETTVSYLVGESEALTAPKIRYALQADPQLSDQDRKTLFHIIDAMKEAHKKHDDEH